MNDDQEDDLPSNPDKPDKNYNRRLEGGLNIDEELSRWMREEYESWLDWLDPNLWKELI